MYLKCETKITKKYMYICKQIITIPIFHGFTFTFNPLKTKKYFFLI